MFMTAFVLFMGVVLLVAILPKQCGSISQKREKGKPLAGLLFKRVVSVFFFVKILIIRGGCTRMYPVYKTRIKGRFGRLYKDKK